jgi:hypothetical protein
MMLEVNFPWTTLSPSQLTFLWPAADQFHTIHHRHRVPVGHKGSHPLHSPTEWTACCIHLPNEHHGPVHPLICERKSVQLTSPSHTRSYGWPLFTVLESLATFVINPRRTFQLQWDLHHTHTMVPLPTILSDDILLVNVAWSVISINGMWLYFELFWWCF